MSGQLQFLEGKKDAEVTADAACNNLSCFDAWAERRMCGRENGLLFHSYQISCIMQVNCLGFLGQTRLWSISIFWLIRSGNPRQRIYNSIELLVQPHYRLVSFIWKLVGFCKGLLTLGLFAFTCKGKIFFFFFFFINSVIFSIWATCSTTTQVITNLITCRSVLLIMHFSLYLKETKNQVVAFLIQSIWISKCFAHN